jgi:hypothetical protein
MPGQMITEPCRRRRATRYRSSRRPQGYRHTQTGSRLLRFFGRCESLEQIDRTHFLEEKLLAFSFNSFLPPSFGQSPAGTHRRTQLGSNPGARLFHAGRHTFMGFLGDGCLVDALNGGIQHGVELRIGLLGK